MKTTIELPDQLLIAAKKEAAERRIPLRALVEEALRKQLYSDDDHHRLEVITAEGGLPPGLDVTDREAMYDWLDAHPE